MGKKPTQKKGALRIVELQESAAYWAEKVLDGTCSGLAIVGPGGLGKTHTVELLLAERGIETEPPTSHRSLCIKPCSSTATSG